MPSRRLLLLLLAVSLPATVGAQTSGAPSPVRDPAAIAVVENSIAALGGAAQFANVIDCTVTASFQPLSADAHRPNTTATLQPSTLKV